ncbi:MAG: LuxR C-terminal-related transcriptional regulator [Chloroflexota bacterium]
MIETPGLTTYIPTFMSEQLIATKLQIPTLPATWVSRPDLIRRLDEVENFKLTLVCASAGYGKTTLLSEWATQTRLPTAWVELDERDNTAESFWLYVITALHTLQAGIGENALALLWAQNTPPIEAVLTALINDIALSPNPIVLILDNYHTITSPAILAAMTFLIDHLPAQLRLIIASRVTSTLPLGRLRGLGHLAELHTDDLRFTSCEIAQLFDHLHIPQPDLLAIEHCTEGWITGLQLALNGRSGDSLAALTGTHRFIVDYFSEEIFDKQPPMIQDFLLQTAIVDTLSAELCDALTGQHDSRCTLEKLERENVFICALDESRHQYRYHNLFAEFLHSRLQICGDQNSIDELHRRAAAWYQANPLPHTSTPDQTIHLSQRELEVLRLIATGLSNHEIAAELVVAVSTVKTHVKSIYRKLNVGSRFEAIERVRELPLPPTQRRPA